MHAIGRVLPALTLLVLFQAGCMKPIHLDISVPQAEQATVDLHLIKGRATGYYPAVFELKYQNVLEFTGAKGKKTATLVVPMQKRPEPAGDTSGVP
ncbi:MAG: hypothetical protein E6J70_12400 [Deltaproteobacteria bacterium]|nr:MAG: hypothetical protein E6J70_12400 [Deltaproteobacteria bacterium]